MSRRGNVLEAILPFSVFAVVLCYLLLFRRIGWFLQDEGVLYSHTLRTYVGQVPYRDFHTGYPPLVYHLHAWLFGWFGVSIDVIRIFLATVHATTAAALYAVARRIASPGLAFVPPALFAVMQPGDVTGMDFHNAPYPAWYAILFAVAGTFAMLRFLETIDQRRRTGWLVTAGFLAGLTFLSKQNAGIFFLWGATGFLASLPSPSPGAPRPEPLLARVARLGYLAMIPIAALHLVENHLGVLTMALFVAPLATLAVAGAARPFGAAAARRLTADVLWLAAGVVVAVAPWLAYYAAIVGFGPLLRSLFFLDTDIAQTLYLPPASPSPATIAVLLVPTLWAVLPRPLRARAGPWRYALAGAACAVVGGTILSALITVSRRARMEHGLREMYVACSTAIDDAAPYAVLALLAAAFVVVWRERRSGVVDADPPSAAFLAIVWIAASSLLAFYPRMDATHLAFTAPLLYVAAVGLRGRAPASVVSSRAGTDGRRIRRAVDALCLSALLVVFAVKLTPKIASWWTPARDGGILPRPTARISFLSERANVYFPVPAGPQGLPDVESFRELVAYVRRVTTKGEPIFTFPALSMIYFVTGLPNPTRHDYFLGSNVSFREQLEIIRTLERARVKTVVLCDDPADAFVEMAKDFTPVLREYLHGRYYVERRIGTYAVLRAYDTADH